MLWGFTGGLFFSDHSFSFLDPKETGSVKVEELLGHWQNMGVEAANEQEIENVISKVMDTF